MEIIENIKKSRGQKTLKILITGIAGFAGYSIANELIREDNNITILGIDNLSRKGSERNVERLKHLGASFFHADIRSSTDIEKLPQVDWIIDYAANPSVLAGIDNQTSSRQVMEHNLLGTINLLEYCKRYKTGLILLSTSRVYSALDLANLPVRKTNKCFEIEESNISGLSNFGISEAFSTSPPLSLYGSSKLASEQLILEYSYYFDFPFLSQPIHLVIASILFGIQIYIALEVLHQKKYQLNVSKNI